VLRAARRLGCAALTIALARTAFGGIFSVDPVRVSLAAGHAIDTVTIRNGSADTMVLQLEVSNWSQRDGQPLLSPTTDLLATPPIFRIPAGATQLVRLGLRRAPDPQRELAYRLLLREVPSANSTATGIRILLSISLPVFVSPLAKPAAQVKWRAQLAPDGLMHIEAANIGNAHVRLAHFELTQAKTGHEVASQTVPGYLLGADNRSWQLRPESRLSPGTLLHVSALTDSGELHAEVPLEMADPESGGGAAQAPPSG
jgi:fimbrial chaperone protein